MTLPGAFNNLLSSDCAELDTTILSYFIYHRNRPRMIRTGASGLYQSPRSERLHPNGQVVDDVNLVIEVEHAIQAVAVDSDPEHC